jgi:hypothetical protein
MHTQTTDDSEDLVGLELRTTLQECSAFWRAAAITASVVLTLSVTANVAQSFRKPITRWVRVDSIRGAVPIVYNDLDYTPQLGEVNKTLRGWVEYRERRLKATIGKDYRNNYYFVQRQLASRAMQTDIKNQTVAMVQSGRTPESTIEDDVVEFSDFHTLKTPDGTLAKGVATIRFTKIVAPGLSTQHKEQCAYTVQFYVNPTQVTELSEKDPLFFQINPSGLTVTSWFEVREK